MKHRTITASLSITIICFMAFIIPFIEATSFSYAALNDDPIYVPLRDPSDAVIAFQSYCKSRDLTIEGSLTDAVTTFTTGAFNSACNEIGINISQLQAEIKAEYDQSGKPVKFFFNDTGIMAMNRIFAQFLQDNELEVGDTDVNKTVYDGYNFVDDEGNSALVWVITATYTTRFNSDLNYEDSRILVRGTNLKYTSDSLISASNPYINAFNTTYNIPVILSNDYDSTHTFYTFVTGSYQNCIKADGIREGAAYLDFYGEGFPIVYTIENSNKLYIGRYSYGYSKYNSNSYNSFSGTITYLSANQNNTNNLQNVNITIVSNTINNNNYEGDTYITNEGDIINEGDTNIYNPYPDGGGTITGPSSGNGGGGTDGTITFPDIDLTLPEINWSIGDLSEKFPFSIPFDLIAFFTVLNAPAEAPAIDADIPLGDWYTWHFEADFSQFDNYAEIIRNVEFIAFCIALIYLTIRLVKG